MKKYNGLICEIADEFHILKGKEETEEVWKCRVIYSLLGRMGYASLWDTVDDLKSVSTVHFKRRIRTILEIYMEMYPEIKRFYGDESEDISNEIYNIFKDTGNIYCQPYEVSPAMPCISESSGIFFTRGLSLEQSQYISGIGSYLNTPLALIKTIKPKNMFQIQENTLSVQWKSLISNALWKPMPEELGLEYLRIKPPFTNGYWNSMPDLSGSPSLARTKRIENRIYYLYRKEESKLLVSQLPEWMTTDYNYRAISNSCLASAGCLPETLYHIDEEIVTIRINYLFPPPELNFLKLYSWPTSYVKLPHDFRRIFQRSVFWAVKNIFESIGYRFTEE